jgi:heterodisulfide reductase subunit B
MGMAFGEKPDKVGAGKHFVNTAGVLAKYNLK